MRFVSAFAVAILVSLGLFWLMHYLVAPPEGPGEKPEKNAEIQVVQMQKPPEQQQEQTANAGGGGSSAPPSPPPVPGIKRPGGIPIPAPKADHNNILPDMDFKADLSSKTSMGKEFGGFAGGGTGGGAGGGSGQGYGRGSGAGSGGKELIPLSTARPQIPRDACRRGIEGYAVAEFNVKPNGHVTNIRIVDAKPRGIFERPMVKSLSHWLYQGYSGKHAYQITFKFKFRLKDCKLNWDTGG